MTDPNPTVRMPIPEEPPAPSVTPPTAVPPPATPASAVAGPPPAARPRSTRSDDGRLGSVIFGLILLGVGLWYFAEHTLGLDLPEIRWSEAWPLILIGIGAWIVIGAMRRRS
jgi:hypothetical protein